MGEFAEHSLTNLNWQVFFLGTENLFLSRRQRANKTLLRPVSTTSVEKSILSLFY